MAIKVDFVLDGIAALTKRQVNNVMRESMHDVGERWHTKYLPLHFSNAATTRYGYAKRKGEKGSDRRFRGSYTARKLKKYGHTRPLEFSGKTKQEALRNQNIHAVATTKAAAVEIRLPQGFNRRHPKSDVRMADEVRAVTGTELRELENYLTDRIEYRFNDAGQRVKARVKLTQL